MICLNTKNHNNNLLSVLNSNSYNYESFSESLVFFDIQNERFLENKNHKFSLSKLLTQATEIVVTAVKSVFQTYVESLKNSGTFDKTAQLEALNKAKAIVTSELTVELKDFIVANYGDLEGWITNQIEASIYKLKK